MDMVEVVLNIKNNEHKTENSANKQMFLTLDNDSYIRFNCADLSTSLVS